MAESPKPTQSPTRAAGSTDAGADDVLGFEDGRQQGAAGSGIHAIVNSPIVSYERLPMLEVVLERLVRLMSESLREYTGDNVEVSLESMAAVRFGEYLNGVPLPALISVINAEEWNNHCLLSFDPSMIFSMIDVLLGGSRGTAPMRIEGRPYTAIERGLMELIVDIIVRDLGRAFEPVSKISFGYERMEAIPRFAAISRPSNAAIVTRLRVDMEDRDGRLEIVFPYATLEPIRDLLLQNFVGDKFGRDSIWEAHLTQELALIELELTAVMDEITLPLDDVFKLKIGSQIMLDVSPEDPVQVRCDDVVMYTGKMGRHRNKIAVQIEEVIDRSGKGRR
jgi:flagellar motor switch protein FliM